MRLLNTVTLEPREFISDNVPPYAILSHVWSSEEVSYEAFVSGIAKTGPGYEKILKLCELARTTGDKHGCAAIGQEPGYPSLEWAWIDTCCIDKRSSAELSEAINSMYRWYQNAAVCYVFLHDVEPISGEDTEDHRYLFQAAPFSVRQFTGSKWHTRGWTLQELLAPRDVTFFNSAFDCIACKRWNARLLEKSKPEFALLPRLYGFLKLLTNITGIKEEYLVGAIIQSACIAQRMSWASDRITTRGEDMTYCLLGIFDVNMPLLYGEGAKKAFRRLQAQLISQTSDASIFAWRHVGDNTSRRDILASAPSDFNRCGDFYRDTSRGRLNQDFKLTQRGLEVSLFLPSVLQPKLNKYGYGCFIWNLDHGSRTEHVNMGCFLLMVLRSEASNPVRFGAVLQMVEIDISKGVVEVELSLMKQVPSYMIPTQLCSGRKNSEKFYHCYWSNEEKAIRHRSIRRWLQEAWYDTQSLFIGTDKITFTCPVDDV